MPWGGPCSGRQKGKNLPELLPVLRRTNSCAGVAEYAPAASFRIDAPRPNLVLLPLHRPVDIAEQVALIDRACGGRFLLTVGQGYRPEEFARSSDVTSCEDHPDSEGPRGMARGVWEGYARATLIRRR